MNLLFIFLTGLTTGGLSCLAVQGGLLASVIANQKEKEREQLLNDPVLRKEKKKKAFLQSVQTQRNSFITFDALDWQPVTLFLISKLVFHTILGFFLGWLGTKLTLSLETRLFFQGFTALFMFATAMNLLNVHPIFRYLAFQPPAFLRRFIRNTSKSDMLFAPAVLGALTIFIPCGITQAMEVLAINSANPVYGALIMFSFVLGTSPLFAILGVAAAKLSESWYLTFTKIAAAVLIFMAAYSANGVLLVLDSPFTLNKAGESLMQFFTGTKSFDSSETSIVQNGVQQVMIGVFNNGYNPTYVRVKQGIPVQLTLQSEDAYSCAVAFVFKEYGIKTFLNPTDIKSFTFTPERKGRFTYSCSMGMYTGVMEVI
jgi:sulfite exporter TauE/SafE